MAAKTAKKGGKKLSPYNQYVKVQLAKLKEADEKAGVKGDHRQRFKQVAEMWKTAPENPVGRRLEDIGAAVEDRPSSLPRTFTDLDQKRVS